MSATASRRPPLDAAETAARRFVAAQLGRDDFPLSLTPDGGEDAGENKCGWAFWLLDNDPTSYVHEDLSVEWYGTGWDGDGVVTP